MKSVLAQVDCIFRCKNIEKSLVDESVSENLQLATGKMRLVIETMSWFNRTGLMFAGSSTFTTPTSAVSPWHQQ